MSECPTTDRLRSLLDGQITADEQAELQQHIDSCERCQQTLEGLVAGKESWDGIARRLGDGGTPVTPALHEAINAAKEMEATIPSVKLPPGMLKPAEQAGSMGRLAHYEILQEVGCGGMGIVLKAFDTSLRRVVAIKVMAPHLAANAAARRRFIREAQAAAAVAHEHVVAIHAVADQHEPPYLAMQFVEGKTLQERLDKSGPLSVREVLRIGMQTAAGLAAAHAQGLVHRDIKPANILLENGVERVKLTDFGLARAVDDASVTQSGVIAGTPLFMSPEQARGDVVDHRSDLFSLGSVMYAMCVGHAPFRASTTMGVIKRVCDESPRPIRELNPDVPEWLVKIIDKLLAKSPADRIPSAQEVADLLGQCLAHLQQPQTIPLPIQAASLPQTSSPGEATVPARVAQENFAVKALTLPMLGLFVVFVLMALIGRMHWKEFLIASCILGLWVMFIRWIVTARRALALASAQLQEVAKPDARPQRSQSRSMRVRIGFVLGIVAGSLSIAWLSARHLQPMASAAGAWWEFVGALGLWLLAAGSLIAGILVGGRRFVRGLDTKTPGGRLWGTAISGALLAILSAGLFAVGSFAAVYWLSYVEPPIAVAFLQLEVGPRAEVTLNGEKVTVPDNREVFLNLVPGDYVITTIKNGQEVTRSGEVMHRGQHKIMDEQQADAIQISGPLVMAYGPGTSAPNAADYIAIQGRWAIVSQERNGEAVTAAQRAQWIEFDRGYMRTDVPDTPRSQAFVTESLVALYAHETPARIDILNLGAKGIYKLERDKLTLAIADARSPRPTDFVSHPGSAVTLTVCRRVKSPALRTESTSSADETSVETMSNTKPVTAATDKTVSEPVAKLLFDRAGVWSLTLSLDRKLLGAVGPNGDVGSKVKVWDAATLTERLTLTEERSIYDLVFLPDGERFVTSESDLRQNRIRIRELATGRFLHEFEPLPQDATLALAVSRDGVTLISGGSDKVLRVWDLSAKQLRKSLAGAPSPIRSVAVSQDGMLAAVGCENGHIHVWDIETAESRHRWTHFTDSVASVSFSPDKKHLAVASWTGLACVFDIGNDFPTKFLKGHADQVRAIAWSADGKRVATASADSSAVLWEAAKRNQRLATFEAHADQCFDAVFLDDDRLATAHRDGHVRVWKTPALPQSVDASGSAASSALPMPNESITAEHLELVQTLQVGSLVNRLLPAGDMRELITVGAEDTKNGLVKFWNSGTLEETRTWRSEQPLRALAFVPSANRLLTAEGESPKGFFVRDAKSFEVMTAFADHSVAVTSLAASPDGRWLASGDVGGSVILWQCDLQKNEGTPKALSGHSQEVTTLAFSPDGSLLASGSLDKTVRIFDVASGQLKHMLDRTNDRITDVRFSDDSQLLAVASWDRLIWILDPVAGNWIGSLRGPTEKANSVALSPDKSLVAAGCFDGSVLVFDRAKGHIVARADAKQDQVVGVAFISDPAHGLRLATAHRNGMVHIWRLRP